MCVIISKPNNVPMPTLDYLQDAWISNDDGAGIAYKRENDIMFTVKKGIMKWEDFTDFVIENDFQENDQVIFHFRITTSGGTNPQNTHPFPLSSRNSDLRLLEFESDNLLFHNGILFSPNESTKFSDTQIFTKMLALKGLNDFDLVDTINKISEIKIGNSPVIDSNRLLLIAGNYVEYLGKWVNDSGLMLSNDYFKHTYSYDCNNGCQFDHDAMVLGEYDFTDSQWAEEVEWLIYDLIDHENIDYDDVVFDAIYSFIDLFQEDLKTLPNALIEDSFLYYLDHKGIRALSA